MKQKISERLGLRSTSNELYFSVPVTDSWNPDLRLAPVERVRARRVGDEMILLHLDQGSYYSLNQVGADVWEGFAEGLSLGEIQENLLGRYDVDEATLRDDLMRVVQELETRALLWEPQP